MVDRSLGGFGTALFCAVVALGAAAVARGDAAAPAADGAPKAAPENTASGQSVPAKKPRTIEDFGTVAAGQFVENTVVRGQVDIDLRGVWLLVAMAEVVPGKWKTFPQLLKVTQEDGQPKFHLLDVRFPDSLAKEIKAANTRTLTKWLPSPEVRKALGESWSQLPPASEKFLDEFLFDKIEYEVVMPDHFPSVFSKTSEALDGVLAKSVFTIRVVEDYRPRDLGPNSNIGQLIRRSTLYGVKSAGEKEIKGGLQIGFIAAGAGTAIPYEFAGSFVMYRLASL